MSLNDKLFHNKVRSQGHSDLKMVCDTSPSQDAPTHQIWDFLSLIIQEICFGHDYSQNLVRGKGHSDPKIVQDTLTSQDAFIHQIWNSYCLKEYRRYAPDPMPILETRSGVKNMVTVTQGWCATHPHPKMQAHTKNWDSYLKLYKRYNVCSGHEYSKN